MRIVGYRIFHGDGRCEGEPGQAYEYILAVNGLLLRAWNFYLEAVLPIAQCEVRGLRHVKEQALHLRGGPIPGHLLALAINIARAVPERELYMAITSEGNEYRLRMPPQKGEPGRVTYGRAPGTVVDIHSHGRMPAFHSGVDSADELGLGISVVLGRTDQSKVQAVARVFAYGYYAPIGLKEVFSEVEDGATEEPADVLPEPPSDEEPGDAGGAGDTLSAPLQ